MEDKGIRIAAHIARIGNVEDARPDTVNPTLPFYENGAFPVISPEQGEAMKREIEAARSQGDSVGGAVECFITGLPAGLGGPYFGGLEGKLSQALFGIPAVKGLHFGDTQTYGSENNDAYCIQNGAVRTLTNHCGGILGGITNGMPVYFTVDFKPTPSIAMPQRSVHLKTMQETELTVQGRHDPCVVPRAVSVVEAAAAIILLDLILQGA